MKFLFVFIFLSVGVLFAERQDCDENRLVVPLATGVNLVPIYLEPIRDLDSSISRDELDELKKILSFDLNANGGTRIEKKSKPVEYVVTLSIANKKISTQITSKTANWIKELQPLPLFGDLSKDRLQMHLIADTLYKMLFGKEGIARTKILYTVKQKIPNKNEWTSDVWQSDYDGGNAKQLLFDAGYCVTPQYLPPEKNKKATNFFYVSYKTGQPKIYLASVKEDEPHRLSMLKGNQLMPTLSYQRDKIAFVSDVTGNPDLFIQEFSSEKGLVGKPRQIFSSKQAAQGTPTFSPDGKKIAFVSNKDGSPRIYVMDIPKEGTKLQDISPVLINKYRRGCTAPAWSPDGRKIAYCASIDGVRQIFVYDLNSKKEIQLTRGPLDKENPSWAPNSLHLAYNADGQNQSEMYILNLNNPEPFKITSGYREKRFPSWQPEM